MKMYKSLMLLVTIASSLLTTQCASTKDKNIAQKIELSQPDFSTKTVYFNTFPTGKEDGEIGYEIHFEQFQLPETMILKEVYFSNHMGKAHKKGNGYIARVLKQETDVIMSSDIKEEAANTPPIKFPFNINNGQLGVIYLDDGIYKYALMNNVLQREPIYHPSASPKSSKQ